MDIIIKKIRSSSITNKYQRGGLFRTDKKKGKNINPWMVIFRASGTVKIHNVCWPFIAWRSKEGQVDWWIKLLKRREFKKKYNKQVLCWYYIKKRRFIINHEFLMPTISSHIHLFRISNIHKTWFRTCQNKRRKHLKNRYLRKVLNSKYTK